MNGDERAVAKIVEKYVAVYGDELQGLCLLFAEEIHAAIGGEIVAGYLRSATGWKRSHWWVDKGGVVYDPIGEKYRDEPGFCREEAHRDMRHFEACIENLSQVSNLIHCRNLF